MSHPRAGQPAQAEDLVDVDALIGAYYDRHPDVDDPDQQVAFGTSGHRGSSLRTAFNEDHILATTQAIVDYRVSQGFDGPLFIGRDTHGLSEPAWRSALEVLVANGVRVLVDDRDGFTPTPAVSHAILRANRGKAPGATGLADGIVVTPSHNPPADGGFKYNPPHGGPADTDATSVIAARANELIAAGSQGRPARRRSSKARAEAGSYDFLGTYVDDLPHVVDLARIREAGVRIGADPLGGASVAYWGEIGERHGLDLTVVNPLVDPQWAFMTLDWDGKIRMDCSSPSAMASLIHAKDAYDISTGNDADADRHGIVTPDAGLMNPNHYLAVAIQYLYGGARPDWPACDRHRQDPRVVVDDRPRGRRPRAHAPRGPGGLQVVRARTARRLASASAARSPPERASCARTARSGRPTRTASCSPCWRPRSSPRPGRTPSQHYAELTARHGDPAYARIDAAASREEKAKLGALSPEDVTAETLAGEPITGKLTEAPGNGAKIGGLKVTTESAWFAARPSGTEDVYKIYAESFRGAEHLARVQAEAKDVVSAALGG